MADYLVTLFQEIATCIPTESVGTFLRSHVEYWWCFDENIQGLTKGIRDLKRQKDHIERKRDEARFGPETSDRVAKWLELASETVAEGGRILLDVPAWNITSRYSMGKRAKETAEAIAKLLINGNFNTTPEFESRKGIENKIIDSLKQSSVGMIGICGMGGIGKTTMAERIRERVKEEDLFDDVVMVTVTQTIDMPKIQSEIAEWLKLEFDEKLEKHISTRADKLRTRLMDPKRKIIILDDVWDPSLKFENVGIPIESNSERCKVLLTSRSRDTCKRFKNKLVFDLEILDEEESWILFKDNAGNCVEDSDLHPVATEVARECKGLPVALVAVGRALQYEKNIYRWRNALSQLKRGNPIDFPEVLGDVYNSLKLSYDSLEDDRVRNLFLMCCLFPEDYDIPIEQLTSDSMGLRDITNIEEARNETHTLVEKLKSRSLLIAGRSNLHVKLHDVVRDVAIYIGSIEKEGFLKSLTSIKNTSYVTCNWMSVDISNEQMEVPVLSRFPNLRLLMLLKLSYNEFYDISPISFEGMEALNVLSFESISIPSLPPTLGSLKNLQTLRLFRCQVENISVIGKLTSLKILSCCECKNITELPAEIGGLKGVRLLELNRCSKLRRIPYGIISSLFQLEELMIRESFSGWQTRRKRRNASLTELEHLRNLTCLEIEISDCTLSAQEILLSQKLVRYRISIDDNDYYRFGDRYYEKEMNLKIPGAVGNWIQLLARNAESLELRGDGSDNIYLAEMENLRNLKFCECSTVKKLVDTSYLNQNNSLSNLKSIDIYKCDNLRYLFSVSTARRCLLQLEFLGIQWCESMERVFWNEDTDHNTDGCIEFPKLKDLRLRHLPNFTAFCQGLDNSIIKFPNLIEMHIQHLPKLNSIFPLNSKDVSFCNLKSIHICECDNLRYLFAVSVARRCLLQLQVLEIELCETMEQMFWNEDTDHNTDGCFELPKLQDLKLWHLPKLNSCNSKDFFFCNLRSINIFGCNNLRYLFSVSAAKRIKTSTT